MVVCHGAADAQVAIDTIESSRPGMREDHCLVEKDNNVRVGHAVAMISMRERENSSERVNE